MLEVEIIGVVGSLGDRTIPGFLAPHDQNYAHPISMSEPH